MRESLRADIRRTLYRVHLWTGLLLALPLLLACITGALLLFKYDFIRWTVAGANQPSRVRSNAEIGASLEALERRYGASLRRVRLADERISLDEIWLKGGRSAWFDPAKNVVVREWERRSDPLDVLFDLHHQLLAGVAGTAIMGTVSLLAAVQLLIGLCVWCCPMRAPRALLWPGRWSRPELLAVHRDLGVLSMLPLAVILITGSALAFPNASQSLLNIILAGEHTNATTQPKARAGDVDWPTAVAAATNAFPQAQPRIIVWPAAPWAPASIRLRQREEWHPNGRTVVFIDPSTNHVLTTSDALNEPAGTRAANAAYPLHAATIGRPWLRWLALLTTATSMLLIVYGATAWMRGSLNRKPPASSRER